jgi:molybdopterin converting factor small subunit
MQIGVQFYSYFKDLAGCAQTSVSLAESATTQDLVQHLCERFPKWAPMQSCALMAVGVEYQGREYVLKHGDEVALFPPVQGG